MKQNITDQIREAIFEAVKATYSAQGGPASGWPDVEIKLEEVELEHPTAEEHGDYSSNVALRLAKELGKNPREVAEEIVNGLVGQKDSKLEKIEVAGPGFINFWLTKDFLAGQVSEVLKAGEKFGMSELGKGEKVVVEYTDPNPFKELHIGHLISNVTGESLTRLQEAIGATVWRADYFGDVGIHVAKSVWGLQQKLVDGKLGLSELAQRPLLERVKFMGEAYVLGTKKYDEDEKIKEEIGRLNTMLYVAAQKMWQRQGQKVEINYDPEHKLNEAEIDRIGELYETGRKWSLDYFETIYAKLGTNFDGYYPESRVGEVGYKYVLDNLGKVFEESDGAVIFRGEKFGLHTRVFINKNKLPTYEAKELGLAPVKYQDFPYTKSIIVVATEIREYFKVLVEALKQVNPKLGNVTEPICTGMVRVPGGKMGSRFGNVVTVLGLIGQLKELVMPKLDNERLTDKEKDEIAEKIAVAAIKYAFLKNGIGKDVVFDLEKSLSFEGDSGPYIQYTYARAKSVLRKAEGARSKKAEKTGDLAVEELAVLRYLYRFPEVVSAAAKQYAPNLVCSYLFELAKRYNNLYNNLPILSRTLRSSSLDKLGTAGLNNLPILGDNTRLAITSATSIVLKNGLNLLGIEALERM